MGRNKDWDTEEDYRDYKRPKITPPKDKYNKHKKAIYDMIDDEDDPDYFTDDYSYDNNYDANDDYER